MPRPAIVHDNTEVQQLLMHFDMETKYDLLPHWMQDSLISACRCNLSATEDLPDEGSAFFVFKSLKVLNEISTSSVGNYLKSVGMGSSERNTRRWAERIRYASKAIEFHGERNFLSLNGRETDIYIEIDKCFEEYPDDPTNPAPNYNDIESPHTYVAVINKEPLGDVIDDISARYKGNKKEEEKITPLQRHIWNLKNDWYDGFLRNAFKSVIKQDDVIVDTKTGEVLEFV